MVLKIILAIALFSLTGFAQGQKKPPPAQPEQLPEVSQTVEAMTGTWVGQMTATVPGYPPETFDWKMVCQGVAEGAGVLCMNSGKASIGVLSESCLLAYDPNGKAVHYMCVSSMGEVHDHKGQWLDRRTIKFEPLHAGMMGKPITETLEWHFTGANTIIKTSEVKLADNTSMQFEFRGGRGVLPLVK